jgi:hypothetical protein
MRLSVWRTCSAYREGVGGRRTGERVTYGARLARLARPARSARSARSAGSARSWVG